MKKELPLNVLEIVCRLGVGGLFIWAGLEKALEPIIFLDAIRTYDLIGDPWAACVAMSLPWLEIVAGLLIIVKRWLYAGALLVIAGMLVMFLAAIGISWARGLDIDCGCFGGVKRGGGYTAIIVQDLLLLAAVGYLWWRNGGKRSVVSEF